MIIDRSSGGYCDFFGLINWMDCFPIIDVDVKSRDLTELDVTKIELVTMLKEDELTISGIERGKRLKESECIRLDADLAFTFWNNQHLIPESWKKVECGGQPFSVIFCGTTFGDEEANPKSVCLYWRDGKWNRLLVSHYHQYGANQPCAVLVN